jgi:uncharacterized protein (TIGR02271 family)
MGIFDKKHDRDEVIEDVDHVEATDLAEEGKLLLREEELDVAKDRVQVGEVTLRKEIVEEHKSMDVPVTHEEVVIERKALNNEVSDSPIGDDEEVIHIPVSKETVEVGKHTIIKGEVSAFKREVEENQVVEETVKREEARIDTDGDPNIVENNLH